MVERYALYDSLLSPVAVVDRGLAVVYFNQAFAQFFQLPPRKIRGKPVDEVLASMGAKTSQSVEACLASGEQAISPELAVTSGAERKEVVLKFFPVGDTAEERQVVITLQDFSIERTLHAKHRVQLDEIKKYAGGLEVLVDERTHELKTAKEETESILKSIGEGIFVVEKDLTIGAQSSGAALTLLHRDRLQGENAVEALFPDVQASGMGEARQKIGDFLASAFNLFIPEQFEDLVRFVPKTIRFPSHEGRLAVYGLSFSPVVDDGSILRVVVAVRDDTELEELRNAAALVHKRVIEALGRTADVAAGPARTAYAGFLREAAGLIQEVGAALTNLESADVHAMFRALHTVKGGARHYGLAFLQHFAHVAEGILDKLRKAGSTVPAPERRELGEDVQALADGLRALGVLTRGGFAPGASDGGGSEAVDAPVEDPVESFRGFLAGLGAGAWQLAEDLGKAVTMATHASHALSGRDLTLLSAVTNHLIRNALDHGLEAPAARLAKGKAEAGRLSLTVDCVNGYVFARFEDDGGGIDYGAVLKKGLDAGLIAAGTTLLAPTEALKILAAPGFSTRAEATEISGRGVGLDAVLTDLRRHGGHLAIERSDGRGTSFIFSWKKQEAGLVAMDGADQAAA